MPLVRAAPRIVYAEAKTVKDQRRIGPLSKTEETQNLPLLLDKKAAYTPSRSVNAASCLLTR